MCRDHVCMLFVSVLLQTVMNFEQFKQPQIVIAYSMKDRGGKSGRKRHDDACRNIRITAK